MDIGFETIIYIILGLIFVLAQVAKNKKKKLDSQNSDNEEEGTVRMPSQPSVLEQLLGIPETKPYVEKPVEIINPPKVEESPSFHQPVSRERIPVAVSEEFKPVKRNNVGARKDLYSRKKGKGSGFNLRHAVIYKTILERKNY